jgi:hypothetical protein
MPSPGQLVSISIEDLTVDAAMAWDTRNLSMYVRVRDANGDGVGDLNADNFLVRRLSPGPAEEPWLANVSALNPEIGGVGMYSLSIDPSPPNAGGLQEYVFLVLVSTGISIGRKLVSTAWTTN